MKRTTLALGIFCLVSVVVQAQARQDQPDSAPADEIPSYEVTTFSVPNAILRQFFMAPSQGQLLKTSPIALQQSWSRQSETELRTLADLAEFLIAVPKTTVQFLQNASQTTNLKTETIRSPETVQTSFAAPPRATLHVSVDLGSTPVDIDLAIEPRMPRINQSIRVSIKATHCLKDGVAPAPGKPRCENPSRTHEFRLSAGEAVIIGGIVGGNRIESGHPDSPELLTIVTPVAPTFLGKK